MKFFARKNNISIGISLFLTIILTASLLVTLYAPKNVSAQLRYGQPYNSDIGGLPGNTSNPSNPNTNGSLSPRDTTCTLPSDGTKEDPNSASFQLIHVCTGGQTLSAPGHRPVVCECNFNDLIAQINLIVKFALYLATFIGTLILIYAGFSYITSGGNPAKAEKAKGMFLNLVIGMIFIICAYFIVVFILDSFKLKDQYRLVGPTANQQ